MRKYYLPLFLALMGLVLAPDMAFAATDHAQTNLALNTDQVWAVAAGFLVPLATYVLNHYAPWADEAVKGIVTAIASAVAGGVVQAITAGGVGFNSVTLQFVITSLVSTVGAHQFYKQSTIAGKLGAGTNAGRSNLPPARG